MPLPPLAQLTPSSRHHLILPVLAWGAVLCVILTSLSLQPALAQEGPLKLDDIQGLMKQRKYEASAKLLQAYIKMHPSDYSAWDMLGVAYYQMGDVNQALKILKTSEGQSPDPAYNLLFQGLSFSVLKENGLAAHYFKQAANTTPSTTYVRLATFELASWYYNRRKLIRAKRWVSTYLNRYPSARRAPLLREVHKNLLLGKFVGHLPQMRRPDLTTTFFAQERLSLIPIPHYWVLESGTIYGEKVGAKISNQRDYSFALNDKHAPLWALRFSSSIGLGPFTKDDFEVNFGYIYHQIWNSTPDRWFVYFTDITDIKYFPFRTDLQSRHHHFYLKTKYNFPSYFSLGIQTSTHIERMGSRLHGPNPWNISENQLMGYDMDMTPWLGLQFNPRHLISPYLYLLRKIDTEDPNFSHQTLTSKFAPASFGIRYEGLFPKAKLKLELNTHYFRYLYNDPYLDNKEWQINGTLTYTFLTNMHFVLGGLFAQKKYIEPRLKVNQCSLQLITTDPNDPNHQNPTETSTHNIIQCDRQDMIMSGHAEFTFILGHHYGAFVRAQIYKNASNIAEQEFRKTIILTGISLAFPNVPKTTHYQQLPVRKPLDVAKHL